MLNTDNAATYALSLFTGAELVSSVIEIDDGEDLATVVLMVPCEGAMFEAIVSVWINEDNRIYGEW
jgi:hypothetical protein